MPLSIGVNLRVTGHCNQGGRKYMEDMFSVAYQQTPDDKDLEYAFFGIFDGHGGGEAATFAKEHLMDIIVKQKNFWSDRDEDVLRAIRDGYVNTHYAMWRELDKWPRTASGLPSTAGTTASIAFIRKGKMYIGHVGDSGIILGHQVEGDPQWRAKALTKDHKPESIPEMIRIQESGGKVVSKSGVPRVVWNRPRIGHKGPVRRSTHIDEIPFLAVARSLGDLWSYNSELNTFVVSPEPDVKVVAIDVKSHRCLIFGTDGLWNMLPPQAAVAIVQAADRHNEKHLIASQQTGNGQTDAQMWINPSKSLVDRALERWSSTRLRADNTSVVTVMLDPPGPSRSEVLLSQKKERVLAPKNVVHHGVHGPIASSPAENLQKLVYSIETPTVPKPYPLNSNIDFIEPKQPDSSDGFNENTDEFMKTTNISPLDTVLLAKMDMHRNSNESKLIEPVDEMPVPESIQVAEVSSTDILGDIDTLEMKSTTIVAIETLKTADVESDHVETATCIEVQNTCVDAVVQQTCSAELSPLDANVNTDTSNVCNVIQPNAYTKTYEDLKPSVHLANRLKRDSGIVPASTTFTDVELRNNIINGTRRKQHGLFTNSREDMRSTKRKHSLTTQNNNITDPDPCNSNSYMAVSSRFKPRDTKVPIINSVSVTEDPMKNSANRANTDGGVATKRRHSAIHQPTASAGATMGVEDGCMLQEPCFKRRTRSEDRPSPTDENDPANQTVGDINSRLSWPVNDSPVPKSTSGTTGVSAQERLSSSSTFQRRSLGKKATPIKTIRRPSINSTNRLQQLRGTFGLRDWDQTRNNRPSSTCNERRVNRPVSIIGSTDASTMPQRWLRSDTLAAKPVKTLRSRNVDITGHTVSAQSVHQYSVAKQTRLSLPSKLKPSTSNGALQTNRVRSSSLSSTKLKQTGNNGSTVGSCSSISAASSGSNSGSGIAKRVKSPYNPSARSLSTRSRIKRLGK